MLSLISILSFRDILSIIRYAKYFKKDIYELKLEHLSSGTPVFPVRERVKKCHGLDPAEGATFSMILKLFCCPF